MSIASPPTTPERRDPDGRGPRPGTAARDSATVAAWTLVSRVTGLARVVVIGAVLGPTFLANAFLSTNAVPNLVYSALAGPVLALVVVPAVVRSLHRDGAAASAALLRRLSGLVLAVAGGVALLLLLASPVVAWTLTLGVPQPQRARGLAVGAVLLVFVAPQVILYALAALGAAAQQARGRFALAAAAPAVENVGLMLTMVAVAVVHRPGLEITEVPTGMLVLLGVGATLSVAVHAGLQVAGARRAGLSVLPARGWRDDPVARDVARRLRRSVSVAAYPAGSLYVLLAASATVRGGVLVLQVAQAVYAAVAALGARAITTAVLPRMSEAARHHDPRAYASSWRQALRYAAIAGLPPLLLLVAFAEPLAALLAHGELQDGALLPALAACIAVLGVAQLAGAVHEIGRLALFARLDVDGPRLAGVVSFAVTAALGAAALLLPAGMPRLVGLCVAILLADVCGAATLLRRVRRAIVPEPLIERRALGTALLATGPMVPVVGAGWWLTAADDGDRLRDLAVAAPLAALATALFALCLLALTDRAGGSV